MGLPLLTKLQKLLRFHLVSYWLLFSVQGSQPACHGAFRQHILIEIINCLYWKLCLRQFIRLTSQSLFILWEMERLGPEEPTSRAKSECVGALGWDSGLGGTAGRPSETGVHPGITCFGRCNMREDEYRSKWMLASILISSLSECNIYWLQS